MTTTQLRLTDYFREQARTPLDAIGGFIRMCMLTGKALFRRPFQWRESIVQCWFVMRVALLPTVIVSIPLTVLLTYPPYPQVNEPTETSVDPQLGGRVIGKFGDSGIRESGSDQAVAADPMPATRR